MTPDAGELTIDDIPSRRGQLKALSFSEVLGFDWQPQWRGGILSLSGQVVDNPAGLGSSYEFVYVDFRIVAQVGSGRVTLYRGALGRNAAPLDFVIGREEAYKRLSVLGRMMVDNDPTFAPADVVTPSASLSVRARMERR